MYVRNRRYTYFLGPLIQPLSRPCTNTTKGVKSGYQPANLRSYGSLPPQGGGGDGRRSAMRCFALLALSLVLPLIPIPTLRHDTQSKQEHTYHMLLRLGVVTHDWAIGWPRWERYIIVRALASMLLTKDISCTGSQGGGRGGGGGCHCHCHCPPPPPQQNFSCLRNFRLPRSKGPIPE